MTILDEIQTSIRQHAEGAGSSVVGIGQRWGVGSGIVLAEGRVLTNAHNVRGDQVTVTFADGRTAEGSVAGQDLDGDLAVIEVDTGGAPALAWTDGASAAIGTPVFALSNPGGRGLRVTFGFVSGVDRAFRGPRGRRIAGEATIAMNSSRLAPVASSTLATDSVEGQRGRPSGVMRFDLLKVVGSSPAFLASPDGVSLARAARRSMAFQI